MTRGPKKHLKRINTPNSWLLSKMTGIYSTRPSQGPHKLRDCLPLAIILKYPSLNADTTSNSAFRAAKPTSSSRIKKSGSKLIIK
jgi:ribosomal protein S4E